MLCEFFLLDPIFMLFCVLIRQEMGFYMIDQAGLELTM